jgi:hypothetical protein
VSRTAQRAPHAGATISSALGLMDRHCGATEEGSDVCRAQSSRENCRRPSAQSSGTMIVTLRRPRLDRERLACISALLSKGSRTRCGVIAAGLILPYHINLLSAEGRPADESATACQWLYVTKLTNDLPEAAPGSRLYSHSPGKRRHAGYTANLLPGWPRYHLAKHPSSLCWLRSELCENVS